MKNKLALCTACTKILFLTLSFFSHQVVWSQQKAPVSSPVQTDREKKVDEDDQEIRAEWERLRTMDPVTQRIPEGIQKKELQYVRSMTSGLRREKPLENLNTSLYAAAGSIAEDFISRGPYNVGGRLRGLVIDILDDQHILAGGVSGGVWSSENQGKKWTRRSSRRINPIVTDIAQDIRNGHEATWYYCTGEYLGGSGIRGNGVFKSTDNGVTWSQLPTTNYDNPQFILPGDYFKYTQNIEVHPTNGDIYVASYYGILKSTDGGATFALVLGGGNHVGVFDVHITTNGTIYAALTDENNLLAEDGIYRSTTGNPGDWTKISPENFPKSFIRAVIGSAPSNSNVLYFLISGTPAAYKNDIWKYTYVSGNGSGAGGRWDNRTRNIPLMGSMDNDPFDSQGGYDVLLKVHPEDENIIFIGGTSLYRSKDGFASTRSIKKIGGYSVPNHHPDQHALVFLSSNPNSALSGCDGGIFLTDDLLAPVVTWSSLNNGFLSTQSYAVSIGPNNTIMSGFQDQDTWYTTLDDPQATWTSIGDGDGGGNAFSKDGVFAYYSLQYNGLYRGQFTQTNEKVSYGSIKPGGSCPDNKCNFVTTFTLDPNNDELLYLAGYKTIWRNNRASCATESDGWTEISNTAAADQITAVGVSTHPANVVYAGSHTGEIFRIDQAHTGNPTGKNVYSNKGLPVGNVSCLAVDPRDANRVLAVFSNYNIKSVFLTTDGGNVWNDVSGNLEQNADGTGSGPSVRWLTIVGANAETYLAGTSTGVYSTSTLNGTQTSWTQIAASTIGNTIINQIKSRDSDGLVLVGSHGNGLFSGHYQVSSPKIKAVNNPMEITVFANASPTLLETSALFTSSAPVLSPLTLSVVSNSERELVTSAVDNGTLTLSYARDKTGDAVIVVSGTDANSNYINTAIIVHIIDAKKGQSITFNPIHSRTYKDPVICLQARSNSGLPITYTSDNVAIAAVTGNVVTISNAGSATITARQEGNDFYTAAANVTQRLEVVKLRQVVTFPDISSRPYGAADFSPGATTNSSSAIKYRSDNKSVATIVDGKIHIKGVGAAKITAIAAPPDNNYFGAAIVNQTLTVTKGIQTITFPDIAPKRYGTADFTIGATINSSSSITYSSADAAVATIVDGKIHITGVGNTLITASATADDLYEAASGIPQILNVSKGTQSISFTAISPKIFGTADFTPEATTNSSSAITYSSENMGVATIVAGKIHITGAGNAVIRASAAADALYEAADIAQTLSVSKATQSISFTAISPKTFGTADFAPVATTHSSSPITYSSGNANIATIVDGKIHITGVGTSVITASSLSDANYNAATDMIQTLTVSKGVQAITFPAISAKTYGTADFVPGAITNSSSAITYISGNAAVATIVEGKIHITGSGSSVITASAATDALYEAASTTQLLTIGKGIQTITFKDLPAKLFGNDDFFPEATTNSSSSITYSSGNEAVATIVEGKIHITGAGSAVITASAATDALYEAAADVQQTLTVSKAAQTISIEVPSLTVGGDSYMATPVGGSSGNPVVLTSSSDKVSVSGFTIAPVSAGKAEISATQSGNGNYLEASASVNFCVNPQKPVITKIAYNMLSSGETNGNQWFLDNNQIEGATSQTLLTTQSGNYSVVASIEGCVGLRSEPLVYTGDDSKREDELTIYPNPTNSQLYVVLGGFDINSEVSISIYSLVGVSLFNKTFMGSKIVPVSTSFLQNGAYIILVVQGDKRKSKLFFKH